MFHDDDVSTTCTPDSDVVSIEKERNGNFSSEVRTRAPESRAMSVVSPQPPTPKHNILTSVAKNSSSASLRSHSDSHNQYYSHRSSFNRSNSEVDDVSAVSMESRDGIIDDDLSGVYTRVLRRSSSHTPDPALKSHTSAADVTDELDRPLPVQDEADVVSSTRKDSLDDEFEVVTVRRKSTERRHTSTSSASDSSSTAKPPSSPQVPTHDLSPADAPVSVDPWQSIEVEMKSDRSKQPVQRQPSSPDVEPPPVSPVPLSSYVPARDRLKNYRVAPPHSPTAASGDVTDDSLFSTPSFLTAKTSHPNDDSTCSTDTPTSVERDLQDVRSWRCDVCRAENRGRRTCEVCGTSKSRHSTVISPESLAQEFATPAVTLPSPTTPPPTTLSTTPTTRTVKYHRKKVYEPSQDSAPSAEDVSDAAPVVRAAVEPTTPVAAGFKMRDSTDVCVVERTSTPIQTTSTPKTQASPAIATSNASPSLSLKSSSAAAISTPVSRSSQPAKSSSLALHSPPPSIHVTSTLPLTLPPAASASVKREPSYVKYQVKKKFVPTDPLNSSEKLRYATLSRSQLVGAQSNAPRHRPSAKSTSNLASSRADDVSRTTTLSSSHLEQVSTSDALSRNDRLRKPFKRLE